MSRTTSRQGLELNEIERLELADMSVMRSAMAVLGEAVQSLPRPFLSPQMAAGIIATETAWREIEEEFGLLSSEQASRKMHSHQPGGGYANDQRRVGKALGVPSRNTFVYPGFQFDRAGKIRPVVPAVLQAAAELGVEPADVAEWFCIPSATLGDRRPVEVMDDRGSVVEAFRLLFGVQW